MNRFFAPLSLFFAIRAYRAIKAEPEIHTGVGYTYAAMALSGLMTALIILDFFLPSV